jgi:hypothetical protein
MLSDPDLLPRETVESEIAWWIETGIFEYVAVYDKAAEIAFARGSADDQFPSIVVSDGWPLVPPHAFGRLAASHEGMQLIRPHIDTLIELSSSPIVEKCRAALFALAHIASSPIAANDAQSHGIIEAMVGAALRSQSLLLRGTLLACLGLVHVNAHTAELLAKHQFQLFKFGPHSCVVPIDIQKMIRPVGEALVPQPLGNVAQTRYGLLACQLLNPIHRGPALKELGAAAKEKEKAVEMCTVENSKYVQGLLGRHGFTFEARQTLLGIYRQVPVMNGDDAEVEAAMEAEAIARVTEAQVQAGNDFQAAAYVFSTLPIPVIPKAEIAAKRPGSKVPEVYLSEEEFPVAVGMTKVEFYALTEDKKAEIRKGLLAR